MKTSRHEGTKGRRHEGVPNPQSAIPNRQSAIAHPQSPIDHIIVKPPREGEVIDPVGWFDSPGDVELEIGCGKGGFLLRRAQQQPEVRLVGIEWANKYFRFAADRMARWGIENVRILRTDADDFVKQHLVPQCLKALHVYHPDPWPKKRHHKRRLIQEAFVEAAARALVPGGRWAIQTDHAEYFEQIRRLLVEHPTLREIPFDDLPWGVENGMMGTNYETKYRQRGLRILRLAVVKSDSLADAQAP